MTGGGYATPGDCLKALALGADGVYMGTALLWAMTHDQVIKAIPWEPPTQLAFYPGSMKENFDEGEAAKHLTNFFVSCVEEMKEAIRALGKTSVREVNADDLVALDEWTSKVTNVRLAHEPYTGPETVVGPVNLPIRQTTHARSKDESLDPAHAYKQTWAHTVFTFCKGRNRDER